MDNLLPNKKLTEVVLKGMSVGKLLIATMVICSVLFTGCKEDTVLSKAVTADTIRLQQYGGMQLVYRSYCISEGSVHEDTSFRTADTTHFQFDVTLDGIKYNQVKHLLREIPAQLLLEQNVVLGNPQFEVDGTATYVIIYKNGKKYTYLLADDLNSLPDYLRPFAQKIHQAFIDLK